MRTLVPNIPIRYTTDGGDKCTPTYLAPRGYRAAGPLTIPLWNSCGEKFQEKRRVWGLGVANVDY